MSQTFSNDMSTEDLDELTSRQLTLTPDATPPATATPLATPSGSISSAALHLASLEAKKATNLAYKMADPDKEKRKMLRSGLGAWLNAHLPTDVTRASGVGQISVWAAHATQDDTLGSRDAIDKSAMAEKKWNEVILQKGNKINYQTFRDLAKEHNLLGGKWVIHVSSHNVNDIWKRVVEALVDDRLPKSCVQVRVTPKEEESPIKKKVDESMKMENKKEEDIPKKTENNNNGDVSTKTEENKKDEKISNKIEENKKDEEISNKTEENKSGENTIHKKQTDNNNRSQRRQSQGSNHVVTIWNRDYLDEEQILGAESALRKIGIRQRMIYKPDIFSAVGIYRNNPWGLRPAIFLSRFDSNEKKICIDSGIDLSWEYHVK